MTLPTPDPAEGAAAEAQAAEARETAMNALSDGELTLDELFFEVDQEQPHRQLGHIHIRSALVSLPHIGQLRADEILDGLGIPHDKHIDTLGRQQRNAIEQAVKDHGGN